MPFVGVGSEFIDSKDMYIPSQGKEFALKTDPDCIRDKNTTVL